MVENPCRTTRCRRAFALFSPGDGLVAWGESQCGGCAYEVGKEPQKANVNGMISYDFHGASW